MGGLLVLGVIVLALVVLDILALEHGVDSRPGFADGRSPGGTLTV